MNDDDPFFGSGGGDRTILRPSPGGSRSGRTQRPGLGQSGHAPSSQPAYDSPQHGGAPPYQSYEAPMGQSFQQSTAFGYLTGGSNPLTTAATTLIALIAQLRESPSHPDPQSLFQHVSNEIREFETRARSSGASADHVLTARYVLCTAIDEAVLNTPWGGQSIWAQRTLLTSLHNDAWGGEKFFQLLDRMMHEPGANANLLELMYLLMMLGFEGKYRIQERGRSELDRIQANLYQLIRSQRGQIEHALSPRWQGIEDRRLRLAQYVPLWVVGAAAAGVLVLLYLGFSFAINRTSDPVTDAIAGLSLNLTMVEGARDDYVPTAGTDLRTLLRDEIDAGSVEVRSDPKGQRIVLSDTNLPGGLFRSGRAEIQPAVEPVLTEVGRALRQLTGRVEIVGHTDDVPMGAFARYRDNWQLSEARAATVLDFLAQRFVPVERLSSSGMADQVPLRQRGAGESVGDWRDANRRVEILLHAEARRL